MHPDEVVALGAAIQGMALMDEDSDMLLLDVTPHALGIMIVGGMFHTIIEQNTTVPASATHVFTTIRDNQTSVKILVLQGDAERAEENELLGEFMLTGLRRAPRGEVDVEVTFDISADGIVSVSARDVETGAAQSITVTATSGLTEDEISQMVDENKDFAVGVRESVETSKDKLELERSIREVEKLFPQVEQIIAGSEFGQDALKKANQVLEQGKAAADSMDSQELVSAKDSLLRTLNMFKGVVSKTGM